MDSNIVVVFGECSESIQCSLLYLDVTATQQRRKTTRNPPTPTGLRGSYGLGAFPAAAPTWGFPGSFGGGDPLCYGGTMTGSAKRRTK
jgi:hypothetical protein